MVRLRKVFGLFALTFTLLLLLAACGQRETPATRAAQEGLLLRGNGAEPPTVDPHLLRGGTERAIAYALFEALVVPHPEDGTPQPGVATRWERSDDGLTWTFHLRPDARWSDGSPVTARDFVYAAARLLSPGLGTAHAEDTLSFLRGARAYQAGEAGFDTVGMQAPDDRTLVIELEDPTPFILTALYDFFPVQQANVEAFGDRDKRHTGFTDPGALVSNGPFVLAVWRTNDVLQTRRNPYYWDADNVSLEGVDFFPIENESTEELAFQNGQLHLTAALPLAKFDLWQQRDPEALRVINNLGVYFYSLNVNQPPLDDVRVRRALALAIDRHTLCAFMLKGGRQPATSFTPPGLPGYEPATFDLYDPDAARALLAEAGFPGGEGFPRLTILTDSQEFHRTVAEAMQEMWRSVLGIEFEIRNEESRVLIASKEQMSFDLVRGAWNATYLDPYYFLGPWVTDGLYNEADWSHEPYDAIIAQAVSTLDDDRRAARYAEAEALFLEQMPAIPIFFTRAVYLADPRVTGLTDWIYSSRLFKHLGFALEGSR